MSSKWNEKLVINFLKQYKQHPCLWNPYNKGYYNCKEKNEALQKIIDGLGTPGFTVNDYLRQIKIIREKYKKEQTRIIKGLQSQKHYKSPFPWYNIVADMLTKVISDEEKTNSETTLSSGHRDSSVLKSLSSDNIRNSQRKETKSLKILPCTDATCDNVSRRSKSAEKSVRSNIKRNATKLDKATKAQSKTRVKRMSSSKVRTTESVTRDLEKDTAWSYKPSRDTSAEGYSTSIPFTSVDVPSNGLARENNKNGEAGFLQCPLCGWEDARYKQRKSNAEKPLQEQIHSVCCSDYINNNSRAKYTTCTGCIKDYHKNSTDNSGDYEILRDQMNTEVPTDSRRESHRSPVRPAVPSQKGIDVDVQYDKGKEISKDDAAAHSPVQMQIIQLNPEIASKFQGSTIEACTRLKIILTDSKGTSKDNDFLLQSVPQNTQGVQYNRPESSTKETQFSPKNILLEKKKKNEASVNTISSVEKEMKNALNQDNEYEKPEDKNPETDLIPSMESKEVEVNIVDKKSKGIQSMASVSKGNSTSSLPFEKTKDTGTTPSVHQFRNICISSECLKKDRMDFVPCTTECQTSLEYYVHQENSKNTADKGIQGCEDTCPRKLLQIVKEDPSIAFMIQQLLIKILSRKSERGTQSTKTSNSQTDYEYNCNAKENCMLDVQKMVSKLKEHAIKTLESNRSFSKDERKELRGKISKSTMPQQVEGKHASTETEDFDTSIDKLTMTQENNFKPIFESTRLEKDEEKPQICKDETTVLQEVKKFPVLDKEVSTYSESRDIGTNRSLSPLSVCNIGTQNDQKLMSDTGSSARYDVKESKISVGTQKRDPILVRVIKCNEGQMIIKSDKETLTAETETNLEKKYIDKRMETCRRVTCIPYAMSKQTKDEKLEYALQLEQKNQVNKLRAFKNFTCDKTCKDCIYCEEDWTDVTNIDPFRNFNRSKIPLCLKPHRCTFETNK